MIKYRFGSIYYRSQMRVSVRGLTVNSPLLPLNSPHAQKFNVKSVKQTFAIIVAKYGIRTNHVTNSGLLRNNVQKWCSCEFYFRENVFLAKRGIFYEHYKVFTISSSTRFSENTTSYKYGK